MKIKIFIWFFNVLAVLKLIDAITKIDQAPASETLGSFSLALLLSVLGVSLTIVRYRMLVKKIIDRPNVPEWSQTHKTCSGMAILLFFASMALKLSGHWFYAFFTNLLEGTVAFLGECWDEIQTLIRQSHARSPHVISNAR